MFDRKTINVDNSVNYPDTIHEHKAPTDDSIRLAEEFLSKAKDRLVATYKCRGWGGIGLGIIQIYHMEFNSQYHVFLRLL